MPKSSDPESTYPADPPATRKARASPRAAVAERSNILFLLYYHAGSSRSLEKLRDDAYALGVKISLVQLKRYSSRFGWQQRVAQLDAEANSRREEQAVATVLAMNERQAQLGRSLQGVAASGLQALLREPPRLAAVSPLEIARLADTGTKLERLALGEATERRDVVTSVWNVVLREVTTIFISVNGIADPTARTSAFADGLNALVDGQLSQERN